MPTSRLVTALDAARWDGLIDGYTLGRLLDVVTNNHASLDPLALVGAVIDEYVCVAVDRGAVPEQAREVLTAHLERSGITSTWSRD